MLTHLSAVSGTLASLTFYYCDFNDDEKKDVHGLLSSMLCQLCDQSDAYYEIVSTFYSTHRDGAQRPSDDERAWCGTPQTSSSAATPHGRAHRGRDYSQVY